MKKRKCRKNEAETFFFASIKSFPELKWLVRVGFPLWSSSTIDSWLWWLFSWHLSRKFENHKSCWKVEEKKLHFVICDFRIFKINVTKKNHHNHESIVLEDYNGKPTLTYHFSSRKFFIEVKKKVSTSFFLIFLFSILTALFKLLLSSQLFWWIVGRSTIPMISIPVMSQKL